eukprot:TRINITY_DN6932_c0_g1_i1.p1 TRINITY_DN6932_c0_g1~~TRINITY_DN6932_c0_g1_i1.p1  ORF type:complete len:322 (+),score=73.15 TRINITY_DN6932_c0_g1_i1:52-1017(+)
MTKRTKSEAGPSDLADERYLKHEKVGEGTYGIVYRCEDLRTGEIVALKKIRLDTEDEGVPATAIREISVLKTLRHPHVVDLMDIISQPKSLHLVFEYCSNDLKRYMSRRPLTPQDVKVFTYQILDGLAFCHSHRILHRDLKPQNILVSHDGQSAKLADFGLARAFQLPLRTYTHDVVTLWYRAPEILLGATRYSPAMDVWSVGAILIELATKKPFAPGECEIDQLFRTFRILGTPTDAEWPGVSRLKEYSRVFPQWKPARLAEHYRELDVQAVDLLQRMLAYDPAARITAADALKHPWFDDIRAHQSARIQAALTRMHSQP